MKIIYMRDALNNNLKAFTSYAEVEWETGINSFDAVKIANGLRVRGINFKFKEKQYEKEQIFPTCIQKGSTCQS